MADSQVENKDHNKALALLALAVAAIATVGMARGNFDLWGTMLGITMFCIIWGYAPRYKKLSYPAAAVSFVGGFSLLFVIGILIDEVFVAWSKWPRHIAHSIFWAFLSVIYFGIQKKWASQRTDQ